MENTEIPKKEMNYAGFGIRLFAFIIDISIYMTIAYLIWGNQVVNTSNGGVYVGLKNEQMIIPLLYFFLSEVDNLENRHLKKTFYQYFFLYYLKIIIYPHPH